MPSPRLAGAALLIGLAAIFAGAALTARPSASAAPLPTVEPTLRPADPTAVLAEITLPAFVTRPASIAARFNLRPESILWGNPALSADAGSLLVGQTLNILPVGGVLHCVQAGATPIRSPAPCHGPRNGVKGVGGGGHGFIPGPGEFTPIARCLHCSFTRPKYDVHSETPDGRGHGGQRH